MCYRGAQDGPKSSAQTVEPSPTLPSGWLAPSQRARTASKNSTQNGGSTCNERHEQPSLATDTRTLHFRKKPPCGRESPSRIPVVPRIRGVHRRRRRTAWREYSAACAILARGRSSLRRLVFEGRMQEVGTSTVLGAALFCWHGTVQCGTRVPWGARAGCNCIAREGEEREHVASAVLQ